MNAQEITGTARTLVAGDKGLLAIDESNSTCNKRFAKLGIPQTEEARAFKAIAEAGIIPGIKLIPAQRTWEVTPERE